MIVRIWRTQVDPTREEEYERFTQEHSLPMFHQQKGLLGVLLLHGPEDRAALTMWESVAAVEALESSSTYAETVHRLEGSGLLMGEHSVEVFEVHGGFLRGDSPLDVLHP